MATRPVLPAVDFTAIRTPDGTLYAGDTFLSYSDRRVRITGLTRLSVAQVPGEPAVVTLSFPVSDVTVRTTREA